MLTSIQRRRIPGNVKYTAKYTHLCTHYFSNGMPASTQSKPILLKSKQLEIQCADV